MSKQKPLVLAETVNSRTHRSDQILSSNGIWAVFYCGQPFNLRNINTFVNYPAPKYRKTSFANPGHAIGLCKKLNKQFKTHEFTVVHLSTGNVIYP